MRATELLRNKFGVSQLYKHEVKDGDDVVLEVYWHPLTPPAKGNLSGEKM